MSDVYNANLTMKLLGQQKITTAFYQNDEIRKEIRDISEARPYSFTLDVAFDIFLLGYIHGKRDDRARRKKNSNNIDTNITQSYNK